MIQRNQRIVFWSLIVCILAMAGFLVYGRQRGRDRIESLADATPLDSPTASAEPVTLDLANDSDGSITAQQLQIALPDEETARARSLIDHLVAQYALPGSAHPLQPGAAVNEVFLLPLPVVGYAANPASDTSDTTSAGTSPVASTDLNALRPSAPGVELAVIDLRGSFVDQHPSGVEVESLTLLSILGTLHANLPQIEQVRFLVDGQPRETLAGHADLLRTYPSRDTTVAANTGGSN
jgi:hypothetical protein